MDSFETASFTSESSFDHSTTDIQAESSLDCFSDVLNDLTNDVNVTNDVTPYDVASYDVHKKDVLNEQLDMSTPQNSQEQTPNNESLLVSSLMDVAISPVNQRGCTSKSGGQSESRPPKGEREQGEGRISPASYADEVDIGFISDLED